MKSLSMLALVAAILLLGCYSSSTPGLGTDAPLITSSKNFTMKEGWQESFKIISGDSTDVHTVTASHIVENAATLKFDSKSLTLVIGQTSPVSLNGKTVSITLKSITGGYAKFEVSLTPQGSQPSQGGGQNQPPQGGTGQLQNGAACSNNSACASNHCSNGYCCASGSCCLSNANCTIGSCSMTTYSCFTPTTLSNGAPCTSNSNCQSNHCNNSYCCASGKCCLSSSNCASGEVCNTTLYSCVTSAPTYTALDAEQKANSTIAGVLINRFASIFNTAKQCSGASAAYKQCIPSVATREEKVSSSTFRVTYSYSFSGTSCCPTTDVLLITIDLSTNAATTQWIDKSITSSLAEGMNTSLGSNCASAVQYIACCNGQCRLS